MPTSTPKDAGKPARLQAIKSPNLDCSGCRHFHEQTDSHDEIRWGECWRYPQVQMRVVLDDGSEDLIPAKATQILPYVCGEFAPTLQ